MGYTKPSTTQTICESYENINFLILHHRSITIEIITGEKRYSVWYQHKKNKTNVSTQSTLGVVVGV
jgi:transcriptional antiterminator Rof (Rho-off)